MERIPKPAYVQDYDDEKERRVKGTKRTAREKPKVSQRDREASRDGTSERRISRVAQDQVADEEQEDRRIAHERALRKQQHQQQQVQYMQQEERLERRKSSSGSTKSPRKAEKQPTAHQSRNYPPLSHLETSYQQRETYNSYNNMPTPSPLGQGASLPHPHMSQQPIPIRPRPQSTKTLPVRSTGFVQQPGYPNYGPPPALSAFYPQYPQMVAPSFPPPSPSSAFQRFNAAPSGGNDGYFTPQATLRPLSLSQRFEPVQRTQSAFGGGGYGPPPPPALDPVTRTASAFGQDESSSRALVPNHHQEGGYYNNLYDGMAGGGQEHRSIRVPSQAFTPQELDTRHMPPPPRPALRRPATEYRPTSEYTTDPVDARHARRQSREYYDEPEPRRRSSQRHSVSYDLHERVTVEPANSSRRRQSSYDKPASSSTSASSYQDKLKEAAFYQNVVGGPQVKLTAESLKKQQRRQAGSKSSTKSSASRDESDYKKSVTTRTTRSGSGDGDENATIKVTGKARVMVGNIEIDCTDGGEIAITQSRNFSDERTQKTSSNYEPTLPPQFDERRSRAERPAAPPRTRMSSQARHSYSQPRSQSYYDTIDDNYI